LRVVFHSAKDLSSKGAFFIEGRKNHCTLKRNPN
jgi:hypothetical protein